MGNLSKKKIPIANPVIITKNCLLQKYDGATLYCSTAEILEALKTIINPIMHKSKTAKNKGLSILLNVLFIAYTTIMITYFVSLLNRKVTYFVTFTTLYPYTSRIDTARRDLVP